MPTHIVCEEDAAKEELRQEKQEKRVTKLKLSADKHINYLQWARLAQVLQRDAAMKFWRDLFANEKGRVRRTPNDPNGSHSRVDSNGKDEEGGDHKGHEERPFQQEDCSNKDTVNCMSLSSAERAFKSVVS